KYVLGVIRGCMVRAMNRVRLAVAVIVPAAGGGAPTEGAAQTPPLPPPPRPCSTAGAARRNRPPPPWSLGTCPPAPARPPPGPAADCPPPPSFAGVRRFAFEEPYRDDQHVGHFAAGDAYIDCNGNGRWDGILLGGGADAPRFATTVADDLSARALVVSNRRQV